MNIFEGLGMAYSIFAVAAFTAGLFWMAFCGIRQLMSDARENAAYRLAINEFKHLERMHGDGR